MKNDNKIRKYREVRRGEIHLVKFSGEGLELKSVSPCIVIQNDAGNLNSGTTIVIPISRKKGFLPTHIPLSRFTMQGVAQCEKIQTIDKDRILTEKPIEHIPEMFMGEIEKGVRVSLGMRG